jgi:biotin operon repressor
MPRVYAASNAEAVVRLLRERLDCMSAQEIADALKMNRSTINAAIYAARARKWIYIESYRRNYGISGKPSPLYAVGDMKDAKRPGKDSLADQRRHQEKMRAVNRLRDQARRGRVQDPWLQLLAGTSLAHVKCKDADGNRIEVYRRQPKKEEASYEA